MKQYFVTCILLLVLVHPYQVMYGMMRTINPDCIAQATRGTRELLVAKRQEIFRNIQTLQQAQRQTNINKARRLAAVTTFLVFGSLAATTDKSLFQNLFPTEWPISPLVKKVICSVIATQFCGSMTYIVTLLVLNNITNDALQQENRNLDVCTSLEEQLNQLNQLKAPTLQSLCAQQLAKQSWLLSLKSLLLRYPRIPPVVAAMVKQEELTYPNGLLCITKEIKTI